MTNLVQQLRNRWKAGRRSHRASAQIRHDNRLRAARHKRADRIVRNEQAAERHRGRPARTSRTRAGR